MPEDSITPVDARGENKSSGKHKWRGKLFSAEGKFGRGTGDLESTDDDVANFLQTTTTRLRSEVQPAELIPRIGTTAAARASAAVDPPNGVETVDIYRPPKPRQNKGLRVKFDAASPAIIGVGGDEADLPSVQVTASLIGNDPPELPNVKESSLNTVDQARQDERCYPPGPPDEAPSRATPLQRTPTGLSDIFGDEVWSDKDHDNDLHERIPSVSPPKSKPLPQPPLQNHDTVPKSSGNFAHSNQDIGGEVSRFSPQRDYQNLVRPEKETYKFKDYDEEHRKEHQVSNDHGSSTNYLGVPSPETLAGNSLTPVPSPQAPSEQHDASLGYGFPSKTQLRRKPLNLNPPATRPAMKSNASAPETKVPSLRDIAMGLGDDSLDKFDGQVRRFNDIFRLGISAHVDLMEVPFSKWIMISAWWFTIGREGLESEVRSNRGLSATLKQAYVNLAKAWWIVKDVTPNHPEVTKYGKASMNSLCAMIKSLGDHTLAELAEAHMSLVAHMQALTMSMKRNEKLPPSDLEIRGLNLHVLLQLPPLPSDIAGFTVNNVSRPQVRGGSCISKPFFPILLGDTGRHFSFARTSVEVELLSSDKSRQVIHMSCVLVVFRERDEWGVELAIASQDGQINLVVSDSIPGGLTWKVLMWDIEKHEMMMRVSDDLLLKVKLSEKDFKVIWGIHDYTQKTRKRFLAHKDEDLVFERILTDFQCDDPGQFPSEAISHCRLRVFEKKSSLKDSTGHPGPQSGYRLAVITPPDLKTLSSVNYLLDRNYPVLFRIYREKNGSRLVLRLLPSTQLFLKFHEGEDVDIFRHLLGGTSDQKGDYHFPSMQLQSLAIHSNAADHKIPRMQTDRLPWRTIRVINGGSLHHGRDTASDVQSHHLRIMADCDFGTLTDRARLTAGELQLSLEIDHLTEIKVLRPPQSDMIWSLAEDKATKKDVDTICEILKLMRSSTTVRSYHFRSLSDVHQFQAQITGFSVLYDQVVNSFAISRRRMVVPISKRWEAIPVRLQVIKQDKTVQLVAFFKNFSHGSCMNFALKFNDTFETFNKNGMFYLRIVDAKFALPKGEEDQSRDFVCLDTPEYPSEHDDVTIGYDNENGTFDVNLPIEKKS